MTELAGEYQVILLPIANIVIPEDRQRHKAEADQQLITSIEERGLINPIILTGDGVLVAGERRLDAFRKLGRTKIPVIFRHQLNPIDAFAIELDENIARKQLGWQDECRAIATYHTMRLTAYPGWTQLGTANALGLSSSWISTVLTVADRLEDEDVRGCATLKAAFNLLEARASRALMAAQSRGLDVVGSTAKLIMPALPSGATKDERTAALLQHINLESAVGDTIEGLDASIDKITAGRNAEAALEAERRREAASDLVITADCLEWAATYKGPKFDVLHLDFPYGKGYSGSNTRQTGKATENPLYDDSPDVFFGLVQGTLAHQDNFTFPAAHCIFWFDMLYYDWTIKAFEGAGWKLVQPYPLIWTKGFTGVASDPQRRPRHCYETALLFARGDRKIVSLTNDHEPCPLEDTKIHTSQKPVVMLKKFLSLIVDEHTALVDLTCGSGSSLVAARQLKAARVLGIELDPSNADVARFLIANRTTDPEATDDESS